MNSRDHKIGYGCPPQHTRFKKGQSGNPRGRPRGARNKAKYINSDNIERMNKIILEEAYRLIPVRDGDNSVELPAIQVVLRSLFSKAAKGDHRAQRAYVELVRRTEEEESALRQELFKAAIEYKLGAEAELEHCTQTGADAPELLPHPDDIDIDPRTGSVDIRGPMTREEKALWDWWQKMAQQLTKEIAELKKKAEQEPNDRTVKQELRHKRRELLKITELIREVNWPPNSPRIPLG